MDNIPLGHEQIQGLPLQLPFGIALPKSFSGAFEKHVHNNYLFPNGDIPDNYEMSDLVFLQLKSHIEIKYGPLYSALLKNKTEIVKRIHHKHHLIHRTADEETLERREAREKVRIASVNREANAEIERMKRDERILRLQHLADLAVNCQEYMNRLEIIILYNDSALFSFTDDEIHRCKLIFDEHVPFKNAMNAGFPKMMRNVLN